MKHKSKKLSPLEERAKEYNRQYSLSPRGKLRSQISRIKDSLKRCDRMKRDLEKRMRFLREKLELTKLERNALPKNPRNWFENQKC